METPHVSAPLRTTLALSLGLLAGAAAAEDLFVGAADLPEVLTATRLQQSPAEVPGSVTVLDRELIRASGARELPELLRLVPGMLVVPDGNLTTVNYHGSNAAQARRLQVLVDGRSVYHSGLARVDWSDIPVAIAAEGDLLAMLVRFFSDLGTRVVAAVAPAPSPALAELAIDEVVLGDLEDLENLARERQAALLVSNSHGAELSARLGLPLLRAGYPLYDTVGGHARTWVGYRGSRQILYEAVNLLLTQRREVAPHRSFYWQGTPRETEAIGPAAPCIV